MVICKKLVCTVLAGATEQQTLCGQKKGQILSLGCLSGAPHSGTTSFPRPATYIPASLEPLQLMNLRRSFGLNDSFIISSLALLIF